MVLCICKCITEREIDSVVQSGARTVDAVGDRCGAGTDCGMCRKRSRSAWKAPAVAARVPGIATRATWL